MSEKFKDIMMFIVVLLITAYLVWSIINCFLALSSFTEFGVDAVPLSFSWGVRA